MKCNRTKLYFLKSNEKSFCIQLDFINFFYKIGMRTFWRLEFKVIISKPYCDVILIVNAVLVLYPSVIFYTLPKDQENQRISFKFKGIVLRTIFLYENSKYLISILFHTDRVVHDIHQIKSGICLLFKGTQARKIIAEIHVLEKNKHKTAVF